ncbi:multidrug efflux MFS transporter [Rhodococcus sp. HNM0563]|uniref:DHA2 family efflux MFS transporter permease subunit n=1 Tax=Rhodococcus sp. HNM0563 TaxID=2716339 RepID=UPI00146A069C|nr:DHA2 family efflux MFS transporter permease subunit [Rhodococcus sp. HNM0563]NLU64031.1 multidrug efflux MFS transporter [Rhodococcus sp. HNM0563]
MTTTARTAAPTALAPAVKGTITVLAVAAFVMILNETVLAVAMPQLMIDFGVDATAIQWLSTGFLLTMAVVIPTTGFLLQRFTVRALFTSALVLFLAGSLIAALAPSFPVMLAARVVQAGGTAIIMPLLMTTTLTSVPPARRGAIMGMNTIVIACAPAVGPTLSGAILGSVGWRWIFWMMVAIAAVTLPIGLTFIANGGEPRRAPLDVLSVVLSAFGFGGIVYALSGAEAALRGAWIPTAIALAVGAVGLVLFVARQRMLQDRGASLLDLRPFSVPTFRYSVITVAIGFGLLLGSVVLLSMVLQHGLGMNSLEVGLLLLPAGLVQAVLAPFVGRAFDRVGPRPLVLPATVLLAVSMFALAFISTSTQIWYVLLFNTLYGAGMAFVLTSLLTVSLSSLPRHLYGHGSAIMNTFQQLAGAAGTALLVAAMTFGASKATETGPAAEIAGARWAFLISGVLCLIAILTATKIHPAAAESSRPESLVPVEDDDKVRIV